MKTRAQKPKTIDEYIKQFPSPVQKKLREMKAIVKKAAPRAREEIKWGMPAFSDKRILVMFGGFKEHIGMYPTPAALRAFRVALKNYTVGKGSIQFPLARPLPKGLITKMVRQRVKESKEKDAKWM